MKNYHIQNRLLTGLFFLYAVSVCGQLNASGVQLWQKIKENSRIAAQCSDENILNFHCGLQEIQLNDYIRHSKNKISNYNWCKNRVNFTHPIHST